MHMEMVDGDESNVRRGDADDEIRSSSVKTQSDDTVSATGQERSLERHPAEFRHTLRKSVHKECNARGDLMAPTTLFGTDTGGDDAGGLARKVGAEEDGCPICLEPTSGSQVCRCV